MFFDFLMTNNNAKSFQNGNSCSLLHIYIHSPISTEKENMTVANLFSIGHQSFT